MKSSNRVQNRFKLMVRRRAQKSHFPIQNTTCQNSAILSNKCTLTIEKKLLGKKCKDLELSERHKRVLFEESTILKMQLENSNKNCSQARYQVKTLTFNNNKISD